MDPTKSGNEILRLGTIPSFVETFFGWHPSSMHVFCIYRENAPPRISIDATCFQTAHNEIHIKIESEQQKKQQLYLIHTIRIAYKGYRAIQRDNIDRIKEASSYYNNPGEVVALNRIKHYVDHVTSIIQKILETLVADISAWYKINHAAKVIQKSWLYAYYTPTHKCCQARLKREWEDMK